MSRSTAILVAGMHRSGTSATAGALQMCGVALGGSLLAAGTDNPKGYFEHEQAVAINERLLARLGSRWDDVRALPAGWIDSAAAREALADIDALIAGEFAGAALWALKDPRLCRLMPLWLEALRGRDIRPVVLFVARDPAEVAASLRARNGWTPAVGELLWLRHVVEAEAASRGLSRTAVSYEGLLAAPGASLAAAMARLGIDLPTKPDAALGGFVAAGDRHQRRERLTRECGIFEDATREASDALERIARGDDAWPALAAAGEAFERAWRAVGAGIDGVAAMAADFDAQARSAREATAAVRSELNAQLQWAEQAIAKQEALHADNARLRSELDAQLAWSEAAVREREALQSEAACVRSELNAQLAWSEAAVREREALQSEAARLQSDLTAQVRWSEQAVADWTARAQDYEHELAAREAELAAIHCSLAWRLSRPLRAIESFSKRTIRRMTGNHR